MNKPLGTIMLLFALSPLGARAECNADAVNAAMVSLLGSSRGCTVTPAKLSLFRKTYYVYLSCAEGRLGTYVYFNSTTCLRINR